MTNSGTFGNCTTTRSRGRKPRRDSRGQAPDVRDQLGILTRRLSPTTAALSGAALGALDHLGYRDAFPQALRAVAGRRASGQGTQPSSIRRSLSLRVLSLRGRSACHATVEG